MGLLDELEQNDKSKSGSEIAVLLKKIIKNQQKMLKLLNQISTQLDKQKQKK